MKLYDGQDRSPLRFGRPFSQISLELTVPTGREYIPGVVKREDSSAGAGISVTVSNAGTIMRKADRYSMYFASTIGSVPTLKIKCSLLCT